MFSTIGQYSLYISVPELSSRGTCFSAIGTGYMLYRLHVFPRAFESDYTEFPSLRAGHRFPALSTSYMFPALGIGYIFPSLKHRLMFPALSTGYRFPALNSGYMFSRA